MSLYNIINQHISVKWQHETYLIHPIPFSCGNHPQFCEIHQAILRLPTLSILSCLYANVNVTATVLMEMLDVTLMYTLKGIAGLHTSHTLSTSHFTRLKEWAVAELWLLAFAFPWFHLAPRPLTHYSRTHSHSHTPPHRPQQQQEEGRPKALVEKLNAGGIF